MADALCGPSNPLQQFKQQTQLDRTLQQDRLASRQSPTQGFRSANPNAGLLDPEFEAFQAGVPPAELPHLQPFQQPPQSYGGPAQAPSWASDFQQMHISSPPPFQQQQIPQQGPSTASWAQGFRQHIAQTPPRTQTSASSPQQFQQMARYGGLNGFQSSFAQTNMGSNMLQAKGKEPAGEQFDEAAFERAFDQARDDMMGEEETEALSSDVSQQYIDIVEGPQHVNEHAPAAYGTKQDYQSQLKLLEKQNKERLLEARQEQENDRMQHETTQGDTKTEAQLDYEQQLKLLDLHSRERIEQAKREAEQSSSLHEVEPLESMQDPRQIRQDTTEEQAESQERAKEDDDALAATAQELLEKVEHNQTDKFRKSQFLGLMRKLRDREVKVEGDKMVETGNATPIIATETQTAHSLNSPSAIPRFDNSEQRPAPLQLSTVETRPYEYGIPHEEQDHDAGRGINPQDGQEVVDMLSQPGHVTDDIASYDPELAERTAYGDSTNGNSSPYVMTRFPPGMRTVV